MDSSTASVEDMAINHCGPNVPVTQQFLNGPNIATSLQKMSRKTVTQRLNTLLIICVLHTFTTVITLSSIMQLKS